MALPIVDVDMQSEKKKVIHPTIIGKFGTHFCLKAHFQPYVDQDIFECLSQISVNNC